MLFVSNQIIEINMKYDLNILRKDLDAEKKSTQKAIKYGSSGSFKTQ